MIASALAELSALFGPALRRDVSMASLTTFRCSAKAMAMLFPKNVDEVARAVSVLSRHGLQQGEKWRVIGRGSNVLVRDGGFPGLLIDLSMNFSKIEEVQESSEEVRVRVEAAVPNGALLHWLRQRRLTGFEFSYGIPGTVGGGVRMNAGTPLGWFGRIVRSVEGVTDLGEKVTREVTERDFDYRDFPPGHHLVILAATMAFPRGTTEGIDQAIENARARRANQPLDQPNFGSVFKNPTGDFAGRLIEAAGLKGTRQGDAEISQRHANFIVNLGHAKTSDVLALMNLSRETVRSKFRVSLEPEVHVIGVES